MLPSAQCGSVTAVCRRIPKSVLYVSAETITMLDTDVSGMNIASLRVAPDAPCVFCETFGGLSEGRE